MAARRTDCIAVDRRAVSSVCARFFVAVPIPIRRCRLQASPAKPGWKRFVVSGRAATASSCFTKTIATTGTPSVAKIICSIAKWTSSPRSVVTIYASSCQIDHNPWIIGEHRLRASLCAV